MSKPGVVSKFVSKGMVAIIGANGRLGPMLRPANSPHEHASAAFAARRDNAVVALPESQKRFNNFRFFFDVDEPVPAQLKEDLVKLGGVVEIFFSKDVTHLISSYAPKGSVSVSVAGGMLSPTPSIESVAGFGQSASNARLPPPASPLYPTPHSTPFGATPSTPNFSMTPVEFKEPPSRYVRRAVGLPQTHAQQLAAAPDRKKLLEDAQLYNMRVWTLDKLRGYVQRYCASEQPNEQRPLAALLESERLRGAPASTLRTLKAPYLMVEDTTGHGKPFFHEFPFGKHGPPVLDYDAETGVSPFYADSDPRRSRSTSSSTKRKRDESNERRKQDFLQLSDQEKAKKARRRGPHSGYCEGCMAKFNSLDDHLTSRRHRAFALNDANYREIDAVFDELLRRTPDTSPVILLHLPKYRPSSTAFLTPQSIVTDRKLPSDVSKVAAAKQLFDDADEEVLLLDDTAPTTAAGTTSPLIDTTPSRKRARTVGHYWTRLKDLATKDEVKLI